MLTPDADERLLIVHICGGSAFTPPSTVPGMSSRCDGGDGGSGGGGETGGEESDDGVVGDVSSRGAEDFGRTSDGLTGGASSRGAEHFGVTAEEG